MSAIGPVASFSLFPLGHGVDHVMPLLISVFTMVHIYSHRPAERRKTREAERVREEQ